VVAFGDYGQLMLLEFRTGRLTEVGLPYHNLDDIAWSPDGQQIAIAAGDGGDFNSIYVVTVATGERVRLTPWDTVERSPAWSPDGKWLVFASDQAKIHSMAGSFLGGTELYIMDTACLSEPANCVDMMRQFTDMGLEQSSHWPAWSPEGRSVVFGCGQLEQDEPQSELCTLELASGLLERLTRTPEHERYPAWSPDGRYLAYTRNHAGTAADNVFVMVAPTGDVQNVTNTPRLEEWIVGWMVVP